MSAGGSRAVWASGTAYEAFMGRWSRLVAPAFLSWLDAAPGLDWLDVGCGTGMLTGAVLEGAAPASIVGVDPSAGFLELASAKVDDPRVSFKLGDASHLPVEDASVDVAIAGLVLNFVPDPAAGVAEMHRATRPGGRIAAYVWDYAGEMQMLRRFWDAAMALDPSTIELEQGRQFPICHPEALRDLFEAAGLREVETRAIDTPTRFADFDDYWSPFLGGQGPAPTYVASLDDRNRDALREHLRATLPTAPDGSIGLIARAWAVAGTR